MKNSASKKAKEESNPSKQSKGKAQGKSFLPVRLASQVEPEALRWLWRGKIPLAKVTALDGDPGVGKTAILVDLAARVSAGLEMPDGNAAPSGQVLFLNREDGAGDTIRPRLEAAGADLDRVILYEENAPPLSISDGVEALRNTLIETECKLCVIDTLAGAVGSGVNVRSTVEMTKVMQKLAEVAKASGAAVVVTRHLRKSDKQLKAIQAGTDSISISGTARSVLLAAADPNDSGLGVLASAKTNLGSQEDAHSLSYEIVSQEAATGQVAKVNWLGPSLLDADALVGEDRWTPNSAVERATDWLTAVLAEGSIPSKKMKSLARENGHSERTVERAKKKCGVVSMKGADGQWVWQLGENTG